MLFQMLDLTELTADPPTDTVLKWEVAVQYIVMNSKEMRMVVADLNLEIEEAEAIQLNLKHSQAMQFDDALMQLKTIANLE
jgi:hypothetical protein